MERAGYRLSTSFGDHDPVRALPRRTAEPHSAWSTLALVPKLQELLDLARRHRTGKEIALAELAPGVRQRFDIALGFRPFRNDLQAERVRKFDHRAHDNGAVDIGQDIGNEAAVDLQDVEGQSDAGALARNSRSQNRRSTIECPVP